MGEDALAAGGAEGGEVTGSAGLFGRGSGGAVGTLRGWGPLEAREGVGNPPPSHVDVGGRLPTPPLAHPWRVRCRWRVHPTRMRQQLAPRTADRR